MTWHGQINRTIWEIKHLLEQKPENFELRRELLRTHFLQRFEYDRSIHIPRDDRSFLFLQENRAPACLLIHGANGTPAEMRDLGNYLYSKGVTVYCPRLSRYDIKNRQVSWEAWVTAAENALTTMLDYSQKTVVAGLSLGGTVALILQRLHPLKAIILLAPALYPKVSLKGYAYALVRRLAPALFYRLAGWNGEASKAMEHVRKNPEPIKIPSLVLKARDDHVVSTRGLKFLRKHLTDKRSEVILLPHGSHTITRGKARDEVFDRILSFSEKINFVRAG